MRLPPSFGPPPLRMQRAAPRQPAPEGATSPAQRPKSLANFGRAASPHRTYGRAVVTGWRWRGGLWRVRRTERPRPAAPSLVWVVWNGEGLWEFGLSQAYGKEGAKRLASDSNPEV